MKFTFRNNVLNIVVGSLFIIAVIIQFVGIFAPQLNYIGAALKYIIGAFTLITAGFNLGRHLTKKNKTSENIIWLLGNLAIIALGILLMFLEQEQGKEWLTPSVVAGIDIYLEGVMLIVTSAISRKTSVGSALVGILFISLGMICFFKLNDSVLIWGFTGVLFVLGLIFLFDGIFGIVNKKNQAEEDEEEEETKPKKKVKPKEEDINEAILEDLDDEDDSQQASPQETNIQDVETITYREPEKKRIGREKTNLLEHSDSEEE